MDTRNIGPLLEIFDLDPTCKIEIFLRQSTSWPDRQEDRSRGKLHTQGSKKNASASSPRNYPQCSYGNHLRSPQVYFVPISRSAIWCSLPSWLGVEDNLAPLLLFGSQHPVDNATPHRADPLPAQLGASVSSEFFFFNFWVCE